LSVEGAILLRLKDIRGADGTRDVRNEFLLIVVPGALRGVHLSATVADVSREVEDGGIKHDAAI
jgi:hypothetical protein